MAAGVGCGGGAAAVGGAVRPQRNTRRHSGAGAAAVGAAACGLCLSLRICLCLALSILKTDPKKNASTVLVNAITLNGILKSGDGSTTTIPSEYTAPTSDQPDADADAAADDAVRAAVAASE